MTPTTSATTPRITTVLASSSTGRLTLLRQAGIEPLVIPSHVDEPAVVAQTLPASVVQTVQVLATAKGREVSEQICSGALGEGKTLPTNTDTYAATDTIILIACDSLLELDGQPVGKPGDAQRTTEIWRKLSGTTATLHSGHYVSLLTKTGTTWTISAEREAIGSTTIHAATLTEADIADYCSTGEPFGVAGALTIDGYGSAFIDRLEGDHTNVIGLSVPLFRRMVADLGIRWSALWKITSP